MLAYLRVPIGWRELIRRTIRDSLSDNVQGVAAQLAYYFFLGLFPALLCLVAIASLFPLQNFSSDIVRALAPVLPPAVIDIITQQMIRIAEDPDTGLLGVGLIGALWSSSAAMVAIIDGMNRAYDVPKDSRPWWKRRLIAIALTIGLAVFTVLAFVLVVTGPELADGLARRFGLGDAFAWTWKIVQWPVIVVLVSTAIGLVYYFAPDVDQDWVWITPGSLLATLLWMAVSLGFRFYVVNFGQYEATYGVIGGIIVFLLWLYMAGLVIVIGAELNAEIEHASPWHDKVPPGQRRAVGTRAARDFAAAPPRQIAPGTS